MNPVKEFLKGPSCPPRTCERMPNDFIYLPFIFPVPKVSNTPLPGKNFRVRDICGFSDLTFTNKHAIHVDLHIRDGFGLPFLVEPLTSGVRA